MGRGVGLKGRQVRAPKGQSFKKLNRFCRALVPMSRSGWGLSGHGWGQGAWEQTVVICGQLEDFLPLAEAPSSFFLPLS